jgi:5,6,7,8-tetrahydromethanopterin hydro-lyase
MTRRITKSLVGEALIGDEPEVAHIELMIGPRGSAVEQAFMSSLASPRKGHTPLLAILGPNLPVKPLTLLVNKVSMKDAKHVEMMFGPVQAGVSKAIVDCVEENIIPKEEVEDLFVIVSASVSKKADDKNKLYKYNYEATKLAIKRAVEQKPSIEEILSKKDKVKHPLV